jgi:DNA adenine methylase
MSANVPVLRYFGGKHRDAAKIISNFPPHEIYCEVFGGGASVLLQKTPAEFEIYNDLSSDVTNFFQVLRDRQDELIRAIELTPYSRGEWKKSFEIADDPVEAARRLYVRSWQSYSADAIAYKKSGWRFQYRKHEGFNNVVANFNRVEHLWGLANRFKQVQIENDPAITVIERYGRNPNCLIYCDPPYVHSTRTESSNYLYEMSDDDHKKLAESLHSTKAMVVLSGYNCELYRELYKDWQLIQWISQVNGKKVSAVESLWISPSCSANNLPLLAYLNHI